MKKKSVHVIVIYTDLVKNILLLLIFLLDQLTLLHIKVFSFGSIRSLSFSTGAGSDDQFYLIYNGSHLVFINKCPRYLKEETEDCKTHSGISHWLQHRLGKNTRFQKKNQFLVFSSHVRWILTFIQNLMQDELQTQNTVGKQRNWHK